MASVADLRRFRAAGDTSKPEAYRLPAALSKRAETTLLCVDQSLRNFAIVALRLQAGVLSIPWSTTLKTNTTEKGNEGNLRRSVELQEHVDTCLRTMPVLVDLVVHETPPVANRVMRPESSLMSAHCLRWTCTQMGLPWTSVSAQKARAHVCGNSRADKAEGHAALKEKYAPLVEGYETHVRNEHLRDALMLGLNHLEA